MAVQEEKRPVAVGMSGGVDSAAAALLLLREGWPVTGVTFRLWGGESAAEDARGICEALGIPHRMLDYREAFRREVVDYFVGEYRRGATPNPCIACNRRIKFGAFLDWALENGFDRIATGHYVRSGWDGKRHYLQKGACGAKDQSYFLYGLTQKQIAHALFPLGTFSKEEARSLTGEAGLPVSRKKDSQDICFVPGGDYAAFLEEYTGEEPEPGSFVDKDGAVLGRHQGIWRYTVGQRKGLGIAFGRPVYVTRVDGANNTVTLGDNSDLFVDRLTTADRNLVSWDRLDGPVPCAVKVRSTAAAAKAVVSPLETGGVLVRFDTPQRAVTPGQAAVFYDGDRVAGGGVIR